MQVLLWKLPLWQVHAAGRNVSPAICVPATRQWFLQWLPTPWSILSSYLMQRHFCCLCPQAFAAVQSSVVHMQGVPVSQRFALVPLGPPLLTYSPTAKVGSRVF